MRAVQWLCGDDPEAKLVVAELIDEMGYVPVDLARTETCRVMEVGGRVGACPWASVHLLSELDESAERVCESHLLDGAAVDVE